MTLVALLTATLVTLPLLITHLLSMAAGALVWSALRRWQRAATAGPDRGSSEQKTAVSTDEGTLKSTADLAQPARQLHELVDRFQLAADAAGIAVWEWDLQRNQLLADARMSNARVYGHLGDRLDLRKFSTEIVHPEDASELLGRMRNALRSGEFLSHQIRIRSADGGFAHIQLHARVLRKRSGEPRRVLGVAIDVTEQVEASARLEQRAEQERTLRDRLNLATQTAAIGIWDVDLQTGITHTDTIIRQLLGVQGEVEQPMRFVHRDDYPRVKALVREVLQGTHADIISLRYRIVRLDGTLRHIQTHMRLVLDQQDKAERLLGVSWDITAEVEHAEQLQEQATHVQNLLERLSVATKAAGVSPWEFDLASDRFLWIENRIKAFPADVPAAEFGAALQKIMHPDDYTAMRRELGAAIANRAENSFSHRFRLERDDGTVRHMQSYAQIIRDGEGRAKRLLGATTDVTNEVQTNDLLVRQAEQERALLDRLSIATKAAGISSWEIDLHRSIFLWIDTQAEELRESAEAGEMSLERFAERIHPDDRHLFTEALRSALKEKRDHLSYRYRLRRDPGGPWVHLQVHGRLLPGEDGRIARILGVNWEVTREIEAAEQLRDAQRRLERASLSSSEGHWEADLATRRHWFSSSYHALLGYNDGELPQDSAAFEQMIHPEDVARHCAVLREHLTSNAAYSCDVRVRTKSGEYRWLRIRGTAERSSDGTPLSISGSVHDIHEQKLAESALRLVQDRLERAINGTQDGLWELETSGAAWCSPRVAELLGYEPDGLPSDTHFLRDFLHPEDACAVDAATHAHFKHQRPYDVEVRLLTRTGMYRWYRARASAERDENGQPLRLSGSLQDVTEARAAREALLRATEAAEAANQAKSEFLANVSHEIRTPMNGIIGMVGLLLDTALDRTQRDYSETIRSSADSLLTVINDILDFSKIEAGKLDIESIDLDLRNAVEDVGAMLALQAAGKNLELVVHVHPDVPARVKSDPQRLRQCLVNLVGNAIKFTHAGEIVIEASKAGERDGRVLTKFEVRDTGIGVAPQVLQTLFRPFVQADSSTTRHFGGTGLGLSIVRRLVEMMGGEVGARSEVGKGSCFWFVLPLECTNTQPAEDEPDLTRCGRRVLVVDDNETNRRVLAGQLIHASYEVGLASGGIEALVLLRQAAVDDHPFEVVLADCRMQDMDGAQLGERINADPQLSRARIVMLTSVDQQGDVRRFASLGFAAYLTKPVRARELFECLDRVLSHDAQQWHLQSQPIVTRGTLACADAARSYRSRVLLVEDNAVNQKVAVRLLERMGCSVRIADNGAEAVKAYAEAQYDLVLMDLQMPVMDGLTATRRIRELESNGRQTPIVALTANAMTGQVEQCTAAGMNGFLTKPIELNRLRETLDRHGLGARASSSEAEAGSNTAVPIALARLNELTGDDPEFAFELATTFIASGEQVLEEIDTAIAAFDRGALSRAAHKLKGASANIHAEALCALALALETQAPQLDQARLKGLISELREEFERAVAFLKEHSAEPKAKAG